MFDRIVRLSAGNPVFVNLLFLLVVVAGLASAFQLPKEMFPEVTLDRISIDTTYLGATAEDVEELVTRPIEDAIEDVADIDEVNSISSEGRSSVIVRFLEGKDLQEARSEVEKAVGAVDDLPEDAETPIVRELKLVLPVVSIGVLGDRGATQIFDRIKERLRDVPGVATVAESGLAERKIFVDLDERKLISIGLRPGEVARAIREARVTVPAGRVEHSGYDIFVKTEHRLLSAADVARIPLRPGSPLRIGDVAELHDTADEPDTIFLVDGRPAVKLTVGREETADPLEMREAVLELLPELNRLVPPGLEVKVADDFTAVIRDRLNTVLWNAITGAILVALVLLVLSGFRQAMLALWGLPVSYLFATYLMGHADITVNVISTFGLLIATGIVVDDAIVVIENVQRHLEMGKRRLEATIDGAKEVLLPVTVAVMTTIFAFMPLTMVGGTMGRVMRILPLVVVFCLLGSLVEAIFILPGHLAEFASQDAAKSRTARLVARMRAVYRPVLSFCVRWRWGVLVATIVAFAGVAALATTMPVRVGAPGKPFELEVHFHLAAGIGKSSTVAQGESVLELVERHAGDALRSTTLRVGSVRDRRTDMVSTGANLGQIRCEFELVDGFLDRYPAMVRELRHTMATNPDLASYTVQEMQAGPPVGAAVTARVRGRRIDQVNAAVEDVKRFLYDVDGVYDVRDNYGSGKETFRIRVDPDRAALYGLTQLEVGTALRTAVDGIVAAEVSIDEEPVDIVIRYADAEHKTRQDLEDLLITTASGGVLRLNQVATIERTRDVGFVRREDGQRTVSVLAEVDADQITGFEAAERIQELWDDTLHDRYPELSLAFGGEADELLASLNDLPAAFALALILIYMILALQFRSYIQPLVILCAVPFGLMGAILGLFIMRYDLSLMALFGIVALAGIVVNDSLVMVDFMNKQRATGLDVRRAAMEGALHRLRPIVSTTLTTCLGLAPLAIGLGGKDGILEPMAIVIATGLGFATLLVLLVVPPVYMIFDDIGRVARRLFRRRSGPT